MSAEIYFTSDALARFVAAQGKKVTKVVCHLWQNRADKQTPLEIIDNLELHFGDRDRLTIGCNAESTGLDASEFDFNLAAKTLAEEFGDTIRIIPIDASGTSMWKSVVGLPLSGVRLTKSGNYYLADSIVLDFGDEKREVSISPVDGLVIDYFEE